MRESESERERERERERGGEDISRPRKKGQERTKERLRSAN